MTIRQALDHLTDRLTPWVGLDEAKATAHVILEDVKGYTPVEIVIHGHRQLTDDTVDKIDTVADRVIAGVPVQYALGTAHFHGRKYIVNESVLIPRPETSQLIDIITDDYRGRRDLSVLDVCTGSGCIAISLALDLEFAKVDALDISPDALAVAAANAKALRAHISPVVADAMNLSLSVFANRRYDIIVSNPPYVLESERQAMDPRVYLHEPSIALFVPDTDPVRFYRAIADYAATHLNPGGRVYLEINPLCRDAVIACFNTDFTDVQSMADYKGKQRFVVAKYK